MQLPDEGSTFKSGRLGNMKSGVVPTDGILGIATTRSGDFVKCSHAISPFEFDHVGTDAVHHSRDIVPGIKASSSLLRQRHFPVLGIRAGDDDFDHYLIRLRGRYR